MDLKELSKIVSKKVDVPEYKVRKIITETFKEIRYQILKAQIVKLKNLMTLFIDIRQPREYFDVNQKKTLIKPRHFQLKVIPSKILKKEISEKKTY